MRFPLLRTIAIAVPILGIGIAVHQRMNIQAMRTAHAGASFPGRRALVVGGTSGIGKGVALRLAEAKVSVLIAGRDAARGAEVVAELNKRSGGDATHEFIPCDASLLRNIHTFNSALAEKYPVLDYLVLTQGIATLQGRTETAEGLDVKLALHFYGRMAFVNDLLPLLRKSPSPRVLSVLSAGVHSPYAEYESDPELKSHNSLKAAADAAGFYNDCALDAFSRQPGNENILFVHAAPGFVSTRWGTEMPWVVRAALNLLRPFGTPLEDCGEFMVDPLFRSDLRGGLYLMGSHAQRVDTTRVHDAARDVVWGNTQAVLQRLA